jgi:hypothetical protein
MNAPEYRHSRAKGCFYLMVIFLIVAGFIAAGIVWGQW